MRKSCIVGAAVCVAFADYLLLGGGNVTEAQGKGGTQIAHMVYFTLNDNSAPAQKKLVEACQKYLSKHPGTVYFSAGMLAADLKRPVNDTDWDVALHLVFKD